MEHLHAQLLASFPPTRLPQERIYGGSTERAAVDPEVQELCSIAGGKNWTEIESKDVCVLSEYLALMSDEAFVAYLPAFLESSLEQLETGNEGIISIVVSILCPQMIDGRTSQFVLKRVALFDEKQARLIAQWMNRISKLKISGFLANDIKRALQSYWARWLNGSETA